MLDFKDFYKQMDERNEFLTRLLVLTVEDQTMTTWEKLKYIYWLVLVTSPVLPRFM